MEIKKGQKYQSIRRSSIVYTVKEIVEEQDKIRWLEGGWDKISLLFENYKLCQDTLNYETPKEKLTKIWN